MSLDRRPTDSVRRRGATRFFIALAILAILAAACVPSLQPLYTEDDVILDERLLGSWTGVDEDGGDEGRWTFERDGETAYRLTFVDSSSPFDRPGTKRQPARFEVHLVALGGALFLDFLPEDLDLHNDLLSVHLLPVHTFWKVVFEDDGIALRYLDPEWLQPRIESGSISVRHETVQDAIVLTAPTAELQRLVTALASEPEAFSDPIFLRPNPSP